MSRKPAKTQHGSTKKPKRNDAPTAARPASSTPAGLQELVSALTRELAESREQQAATADVLKVISRSTFDLRSVLQTLVESAVRLCEADQAAIARQKGTNYQLMATHGYSFEFNEYIETLPLEPGRGSLTGRVLLDRKPVQVADVLTDPDYAMAELQKKVGFRTMLGVPLLREGVPIGVLILNRTVVRPFTDKQIELVSTFADQAVIAIENARLVGELCESLQQQTATADVLKVISRSTFDLQVVLNTLVESAARLCGADIAAIHREHSLGYQQVATYGYSQGLSESVSRNIPFAPARGSVVGRTVLEGKTVHVSDVLADPEYTLAEWAKQAGFRSTLGIPLLREGKPIGVIFLARSIVRPFTDREIELATTFTDQAVIAMENVRLFDKVQERTRDLSESLQQQTATADVLKVISRSTFDLQAVLHTLVESAARLCDADKATIARQQGAIFFRMEAYGTSPEYIEYARTVPEKPGRESAIGRALLERRVIHIPDVQADSEYNWAEAQRFGSFRTSLGVPMLRDGVPIGLLD